MDPQEDEFTIDTEMIRLGQFLKLANLVDDGMEAKIVVQAGEVQVNGETETRRGRQLFDGDEVRFAGETVRIRSGAHGAD